MAEYVYEALDKQGKQVKGVIEAGDEDVIVERLRDMGYYPLAVVPHRRKAMELDLFALPGLRRIFHRIKPRHVMTFTRQLATLIDAGLPILRSLTILREQVESAIFKEKIARIGKDIESGATLSEALAGHPKVFDKLYVNMVRAGELGGVLEVVLNRIATFLEKRQAMVSKVRSAMMYPAVVLGLASVIVGFILLKIVPRFTAIFVELGAELPLPTRMLVDASGLLIHRWYLVPGLVFLAVATYRQVNRTSRGRFLLDSIKLNLPVFGTLLQKTCIARFASTLATLITAGVPILQALDITRDSSGNEVLARALDKVYRSVKDGETIHEPLSQCSLFPPLVYHMVAVGEETGAIDQMLVKVAEAYEREVEDMVDGLSALLEPLLIVFLGILVGGIVIALYLPLFNLPEIISKQG